MLGMLVPARRTIINVGTTCTLPEQVLCTVKVLGRRYIFGTRYPTVL